MGASQYEIDASQNPADGKFYGTVKFGADVIATAEQGFRDINHFEKWARSEAWKHRVSITPSATHRVLKTFSL